MMKIVAVIPSRAGSKGIPNKNIRMVSGHPLIYYSLKNALSSKFISKVLVSTDSYDVKTIAESMGAEVIWRKKELCDDKTTLDAVIFDAVKNLNNYDYVVTMQPTSPTLKASSLDKAIQKTIDENLDTVISAINKPHLSWRFDGEKYAPNYKERLNRQYLPPNFLETGAFVISKFEYVTASSRIGKKVSIYELSEDEAVDIDSFDDLVAVKNILESKKIGIYVNGNNEIGLGHIYRVLELADEFNTKPDIYFDKNVTNVELFGNTTHKLCPISSINELLENCEANKYLIFINDILSTDVDYMEKLREKLPQCKIVNFEDCGEGATKADIVFNALLGQTDMKNVKFGEKYYICGKSFLFHEPITINEKVQNILICFGGADPQNYTERILSFIADDESYKNTSFTIVLGRAKKNIEKLMEFNNSKNISVVYDVKNMADLMSKVDIAVTSRGRTGYELAILGIPTLSMAQNSREELHDFVSKNNGFLYLGLNPSDHIIKENLDLLIKSTKQYRQDMQNKMLSHDLKHGRERVIELINKGDKCNAN